MQDIDGFIKSLLDEKGITDTDSATRSALEQDMRSTLISQINEAIIIELSDEEAAKLASMAKNPEVTNRELEDFIEQSGINLTGVTLDVMTRFRNAYLGME